MSKKRIHVVAAVIENNVDQIFIAKRPNNSHQGGLWEFPGGKMEYGETPTQALNRELFEELGIQAKICAPLIKISHDYPDKSILLDVWRVSEFDGIAHGKEGQETQWVNKNALKNFEFPAANQAIILAATLPQQYLITPEPDLTKRKLFLQTIEQHLKKGIRLIQLRGKSLSEDELKCLFAEIQQINQSYNASILINTSLKFAIHVGATAVHLPSKELMQCEKLPDNMLVSTSCHSAVEIEKAIEIGVSFIVLSPVLKTDSHPNANPLGWAQFEFLCNMAPFPVYALGGMKKEHLPQSIQHGAQGIAAIRSLW